MPITHSIGRRKTSVARIYLEPGNGTITVNDRDYKEYFPTEILHYKVTQALVLAKSVDKKVATQR